MNNKYLFVYVFITFLLFFIGSLGLVFSKANFIMLLISLEVLILAVNINLVINYAFTGELSVIVYSLINLTAAAAESALGLAILTQFFRIKGGISLDLIVLLKS